MTNYLYVVERKFSQLGLYFQAIGLALVFLNHDNVHSYVCFLWGKVYCPTRNNAVVNQSV